MRTLGIAYYHDTETTFYVFEETSEYWAILAKFDSLSLAKLHAAENSGQFMDELTVYELDGLPSDATMSRKRLVETNPRVAGYQFGPYWLECKGNRISGLCGDTFQSEGELCASFDDVGAGGPLIRVYENGEKVTLRK